MAEQTLTPLGKHIADIDKYISEMTRIRNEYRKGSQEYAAADLSISVAHGCKSLAEQRKPDERALAEKMYRQGAIDYAGTAGVDKTMAPKTYEKWESELNADTKETFDKFYTQEPK